MESGWLYLFENVFKSLEYKIYVSIFYIYLFLKYQVYCRYYYFSRFKGLNIGDFNLVIYTCNFFL